MKSSMDQLNEPDSANCAEDDGSIENRGRKQIKFYRHASQTNRNVNKLYYNTNEEDNEEQAQAQTEEDYVDSERDSELEHRLDESVGILNTGKAAAASDEFIGAAEQRDLITNQ